jgi:hypothetical protein
MGGPEGAVWERAVAGTVAAAATARRPKSRLLIASMEVFLLLRPGFFARGLS